MSVFFIHFVGMLCFFGIVYTAAVAPSSIQLYQSASPYTWSGANASCLLLGSELSGSLLANTVNVTNVSDIKSTGWIGADAIPNGTVQFAGCFLGRLNSEPGLILSTDYILHCNHFCSGSGFMFHHNTCYCRGAEVSPTGEPCAGRHYNETSVVMYGIAESGQELCLCRYNQTGDTSDKQLNTLCNTEHTVNSTPCYDSSNYKSTTDEILNGDLNFTQVQLQINGTETVVWNVSVADLDSRYSVYWTGAVRRDIFVWGGAHLSTNSNEMQSCVVLFTSVPVMINRIKSYKDMLFPVKSPCNHIHPGICVRGAKRTTLQPSTISAKALKTTQRPDTKTSSLTISSIYNGTTKQHSTSVVNTPHYNQDTSGQTVSPPAYTSPMGTPRRDPETSTSLVDVNTVTARQTNLSTVNSGYSGGPVSTVTHEYISKVVPTTGGTVKHTSSQVTSPNDIPGLTGKPVSGSSSGGNAINLLGPIVGGTVSVVVLLIGCITVIFCLNKRRKKATSSKKQPTNSLYVQNSEFLYDNEEAVRANKYEMRRPLHNESMHVSCRNDSEQTEGMCDSVSERHWQEDGQNHYDHIDTGSGDGYHKRGDNCAKQADGLYDQSRITDVNSGGEYDSFQTVKDMLERSVSDSGTGFGCAHLSSARADVDLYDHSRANDRNTGETYDSIRAPEHHGDGFEADYGRLRTGANIAGIDDDLYDHSRVNDDFYDTFKSGQTRRDASDNYDYVPLDGNKARKYLL